MRITRYNSDKYSEYWRYVHVNKQTKPKIQYIGPLDQWAYELALLRRHRLRV